MHFYVVFNAQLHENNDFTLVKCIFLRFCILGTCLARGSKMHAKIDGFSGRKLRKNYFSWILASIWEGLGEVWGPKMGKLGVKKAT